MKRLRSDIVIPLLFTIILCAGYTVWGAYSFQTFNANQVLTSAQMNQVEVNIRDHVHGTDGVVELSAYTRLADNETITGQWTVQSNAPQIDFKETGVTADNGWWQFYVNGETLQYAIQNDAGTVATQWLKVDRTGTTVDAITFPNGNILMGTGSIAPDAKLHIYEGDSGGSSASGTKMTIEDSGSTALQFLVSGTTGSMTEDIYFGDAANNTQGVLRFDHTNGINIFKFSTDGGNNYRMSINSSGQLESTHTTGTAPFVIASTTSVSNLNADLLDGVHATASGEANKIPINNGTIMTNLHADMVDGLHVYVYNINDWNMDATGSVSIAHGLTMSKIRSVNVLINRDGSAVLEDFEGHGTDNNYQVDGTNVTLSRELSGFFDTTSYDATSYNRGYITIWYVP